MATLEQIIQREVNPFDSVTFTTGNFWTEDKQPSSATVESIHQEAITQIQDVLQNVIRDGYTRTVLLTGDSGCGKSYLLSRLKNTLNNRAFFAYIDPCPSNDGIWRHTLRYTVDSLMHVPEGKQESQLLLWLKGLSAYRDRGIKKKILGAKTHFIHELRSIYPTEIYQPGDFFAVLYALTNPELYFIACDWLRGNSINEDELKALGVKSIIDSEEAARGIIGNFGRIAADNKPIVLCFDQLELAAKFSDGSLDLSSVFNVNTTLHNDNIRNFLVIISIIPDIWMTCKTKIHLAEQAKINKKIDLKQINLEQVEALWTSRLAQIHRQVNPKPKSPIEPLKKQDLERKYPGKKANLRSSLSFGGKLYQEFKESLTGETPPIKIDPPAAFQLFWQQELNKTRNKISRIRQLSSPELIEMLISSMNALGIKNIQTQFLDGKYASYSFSYQSNRIENIGILWNEDSNMKSFCFAMKACEKSINLNPNIPLKLIRAEPLGKPTLKGYKLYQKLFKGLSYNHITPDLESVHYLKTYQKLANDARSGDLVLNFEPLSLAKLENLVRETKVLDQCCLLQNLKIVLPRTVGKPTFPEPKKEKLLQQVKEFLFNLVKHHHLLGQEILIKQAKSQFAEVEEAEIDNLIQELCEEKKISFVNPTAKPNERLVCLVPQ